MAFPELTQPELVKLDGCIREMQDSAVRIEGEKNLQKDICDRVKDEFKVSPTDFKKLVAQRTKEKSTQEIHKHQEVEDFDDTVTEAVRRSKKS